MLLIGTTLYNHGEHPHNKNGVKSKLTTIQNGDPNGGCGLARYGSHRILERKDEFTIAMLGLM